MSNTKLIFEDIYKKNKWGNSESLSGPSSTLCRTVEIRKNIPLFLTKYSIYNLLDAPCGDLNWMSKLIEEGIFKKYTGIDIVQDIIKINSLKFKKSNVNFLCIDIIRDSLPDADVMLCRDCLFHFSYSDFWLFIENFCKSNISYLLTTTHHNFGGFVNKDISTGNWKWMDLVAEPYLLPDPIDSIADGSDRQLCLWSKSQLFERLKIYNMN